MAVDLVDILQARRNRRDIEYTKPPILQEEEDELAYIKSLEDSYTPPTVAPSTSFSLPMPDLGAIGRQQQELAAQEGEGLVAGTKALGETALSVGTGVIGGGLGLGHMVEQVFRDRGPQTFMQGVLDPAGSVENLQSGDFFPKQSREVPPNYWKNLLEQGEKVAAEHTYVPRTPEGRAVLGTIAPVFEGLRTFSKMASEATIPRLLLTDDQRELVRYGHELVTAGILGELAIGGIKGLGRARVKNFQDSFVEASKEPSGGPATERLVKASEDITKKAAETPEISERLQEPARTPEEIDTSLGNITKVRELEKDPTLAPRYREQGQTLLEHLNENPENTDYQASAAQYFEKTRGFEDATVGELRASIGDSLGIADPIPEQVSPTPAIRPSKKMSEAPPVGAAVEGDIPITPTPQEVSTTEMTQIVRQGRGQYELTTEEGIHPELFKSAKEARVFAEVQRQQRESAAAARDVTPPTAEIPLEGEITPTTASTAPAVNPYTVTTRGRGDHVVSREGMPDQAFTNRRAAERYIQREWKNEQAPPEARAAGEVLEDISRSPGRGRPSNRSTEELLQASEHSNSFANREDTIRTIQKSLEDRVDISREIMEKAPTVIEGEMAAMHYRNLKAIAEKGLDTSDKRGIRAILHDIAELMAFESDPTNLGMFGNITISHRQKLAAKRLLADVMKDRGVSEVPPSEILDKHLEEAGLNPATRLVYKDYLDSLSNPVAPPSGQGPRSMPLDGSAMTDNPVIESRVTKANLLAPRVFSNELKTLQEANPITLSTQWASGELPSRTMKRASQETFDMFMPHYRAIQKDIRTEVDLIHADLKKVERLVNYTEKRMITEAIESGNPASLKGTPKQVYDILDAGIEGMKPRIEETRNAIGVEPLPDIVDNMEFMRAVQSARSNGNSVNLTTIGADELSGVIRDFSAKPMQSSWTQKTFRMTPERDVFRQFSDFQTRLSEQLNLSPFTAKVRELIEPSHLNVVEMDGSQYNLKKENPGLHTALRGWVDTLDGVPVGELNALGVKWDPVFRFFTENLAWSMLAGSVRSIMAQPFGLILTQHKYGAKNTIAAAGDALASVVGKSKNWDRMLATSDVVSSRSNAPLWSGNQTSLSEGVGPYVKESFKGSLESLREGRVREAMRAEANMLLAPMEQADHVAAGISWLAAEKDGISKGLSGIDLKRYADEGVISTQASGWRGDMTPVQRTALGKSLLQFGNVTFTEWDFMVNEVIKPMKNEPIGVTLQKVGKLVGIMAALDLGSVLTGYDPPTPTPINDFMRSRANKDSLVSTAFKVGVGMVAPYAPIFGKATFGKGIGGPLVSAGGDIVQSLLNRPGAHNVLEPMSELAGIPGSATWWRIHRLKQGHPEATTLKSLLAIRPDPKGTGMTGMGSGMKGMGSGMPK